MKNKITTIIIIFLSFLFIQNVSLAIDSIEANQQNTINAVEPAEPTINNSETPISPTIEDKNTKSEIKPATPETFKFIKSPDETQIKANKTIPNSRYTIYFKGRAFDLKKHLSLGSLLAIVGLTGTFFGLFSTWLIYHLNKKNNNPVIMDKHHSAIQYMDELNQIKIYFSNSKIKELYPTVYNPPIKEETIKKLAAAYEDICKNISKIDLIRIHTRYKKHIKKSNNEFFNSLIENYKIIKTDGDRLNSIDTTFEDLDLETLKSQSLLILTFKEQLENCLKILRKELKL